MSINTDNKKNDLIEAAAEQWVNIVFAHLDSKRKNKKTIKNNKKEYKYEQPAN